MSERKDGLLPLHVDAAPIQEPEPNMLAVIAQAVANPQLDVVKMQALLDMHERIMADQRRIAFDAAMTRLQAKIPPMPKFGEGKNSKFAKYEDIARVIKPLLAEEGFSLAFSEDEQVGGKVRFVLEVARDGHSKFFRRTYSVDVAAKNREGISVRPAIQDDGSTTSYARRGLVKMALDIVETDDDNNGDDAETITSDQAKDLAALIDETKSNKANFLKLIAGTDKLENILARDYSRCVNALVEKRRNMK